jgi:hypothetical protein
MESHLEKFFDLLKTNSCLLQILGGLRTFLNRWCDPTAERLRELVVYSPTTGIFTRLIERIHGGQRYTNVVLHSHCLTWSTTSKWLKPCTTDAEWGTTPPGRADMVCQNRQARPACGFAFSIGDSRAWQYPKTSGTTSFVKPIAPDPLARSIVAIVAACSRFPWIVLALTLLATTASGYYTATHFAINTNTNEFISAKLQWRQDLIALDNAFPQRVDQIVVVIDGATPELAEAAAQSLTDKLKRRLDLYRSVVRPDGGSYFNQNGLLFQPVADLRICADRRPARARRERCGFRPPAVAPARRFEIAVTGSSACDANWLAAPLGPRLFGSGGAQKTRPDACLREDRRRARLSRHRE